MDAKQAQIKLYLDQHLGVGTPHKNGEVSYYCPFCNHYKKKLQVNLTTQKWHCWVDGAKGNSILTLLKKSKASQHIISQVADLVDYIPNRQQQTEESETRVVLPDGYIPLWKGNESSPYFKNALHYLLEKRKLTKFDILKYQIGYCEEGDYSGMIIIPSYDENGILNYFVGRSFYGEASIKHKNPEVSKDVVGFESNIDWTQPITIVEGAFDAIATKRNAIPLFGKKILPKLRQKIMQNKVSRLYLSLDKDALSDAIAEVEFFMNNGVDVRIVNLAGKDPSDTGFIEMNKLVRQTPTLDLFDLITLKMSL
jgi:DNA primase